LRAIEWAPLDSAIVRNAEEAGKLVIRVEPEHLRRKCSKCQETVKSSLPVWKHGLVGCGHVLGRRVNVSATVPNSAWAALTPPRPSLEKLDAELRVA
jgi:hypothetical protein